MIYLQELFNNLAYGQFSNMAIGNAATGSIEEEQYPKVVSLINSALLDIYTRLPLKRKEFDLYQREDVTIYYLRPEYVGAVDTGDPYIYIDGTAENVVDGDIIKLLNAYDSAGNEIYINKEKYPDDIFTPEFDTIKVALRDPLEIISVVYQAAYPKIVIGSDFDPTTYALYYPGFIGTALEANIAARLLEGKSTQATEGQGNPANTFQYKYERECLRLSNLNLIPEEEPENERFIDNGWA